MTKDHGRTILRDIVAMAETADQATDIVFADAARKNLWKLCSPDAMRAIAEYVSGLEREIEHLHLSNQTVADELGNEISRLQRELADARQAYKVLLEASEQMTLDMIDARRNAFAEAAAIAAVAKEMRERLFAENGASINASKAVQAEEIAAAIRSRADGSVMGFDAKLTVAIEEYAAKTRRQAFEEVGGKAREYAAHYPEASDGRNTFIIFAEWAEGRP